ncbi:unnamed protein product [Caenorhabditis auriculariae]|uniref:Uncharacterized protein n=1 Tax=Caenorhabditis auriculariae TaxID=2777116 RepID=A0A8S1GNY5_9PELO|nr:unnamed protein product [Caenorhabditis auriculariae]
MPKRPERFRFTLSFRETAECRERTQMVDQTPIIKDIFVSPKFKAFLAEKEGCDLVDSLEKRFRCIIHVVGSTLMISHQRNTKIDVRKIEKTLREMWHQRDVHRTIREAVLNSTCGFQCNIQLTKAQAAVVSVYCSDIIRRSRIDDILIDHFDGRIKLFGEENTVSTARNIVQHLISDHFGPLEEELELPFRTERYPKNLPSDSNLAGDTLFSHDSYDNLCEDRVFNDEEICQALETRLVITPPPKTKEHSEESIKFQVASADVAKLTSNRGSLKKKIEAESKCTFLISRESESFGMIPVEIVAETRALCQQGRTALEKVLLKTPEKPLTRTTSRYEFVDRKETDSNSKRNSFRNQPKVLLQLSPRKSSS